MTGKSLEQLVEEAKAGSRQALEQVLEGIQENVYGLSLRMLWHPEDAQDASQEILIRVMTHLGGFRGDSVFRTWVYRVAANYLLDVRKSRLEAREYSFEKFSHELDENLASAEMPADDAVLLEEIKIGCTLGMLLCLDRPHRLAYILGDILELGHVEAAAALSISAAAYRKRLSRARAELVAFLRAKCGSSIRRTPAGAGGGSAMRSNPAASIPPSRYLRRMAQGRANFLRCWLKFGGLSTISAPPHSIARIPSRQCRMTSRAGCGSVLHTIDRVPLVIVKRLTVRNRRSSHPWFRSRQAQPSEV